VLRRFATIGVVSLFLSGCAAGDSGGPDGPPEKARIEALKRATPQLPFAQPLAQDARLLDVARVTLSGGEDARDVYLAELVLNRSSHRAAVCYMHYLLRRKRQHLESSYVHCGDPAAAIDLWSIPVNPDPGAAMIGTTTASVDEVRVSFSGDCGVSTYAADGPVLRLSSDRRAFILPLEGCEWARAEALRRGVVVGTAFRPSHDG
jgi:hypothetical protein